MGRAGEVPSTPLDQVHWSDGAPAAADERLLHGEVTAEVAIVGGGMSGLAAALALAEAGRDVAVIEAHEPGFRASGRNAAHLAPMFWGMKRTPQQIVSRFGEDLGGRMNRLAAGSGERMFDLIERRGISCQAVRGGYVAVARTEASLGRMRETLEQWRRYGGRFEPLQRDELGTHVASPRYAGGALLPDGGRVNPLALTRGLAAAAKAAGARLFTHSPVLKAEHANGCWTLRTGQGQVRAKCMLAFPGADAVGAFASMSGLGAMVTAGVVCTDPLPDGGQSILPRGGPIVDLDDPAVFGPLIDADGRLVVSFLAEAGRLDLPAAERIIRPRLRRAFPQLADQPFTRLWGGRFLITASGAPLLLRLGEDGYAMVGCNGFGHTLAISAAQELARLVMGAEERDLALPVSNPRPSLANGLLGGLLACGIAPLANRLGA